MQRGSFFGLIDAGAGPNSLDRLGEARASGLRAIGIPTVGRLLQYPPLLNAREILAAARNGRVGDVAPLLSQSHRSTIARDLPNLPLSALRSADQRQVQMLAGIGIKSVDDLAGLAVEAENIVVAAAEEDEFFERPSAPAELIPAAIGSVSSNVRFTTFAKDDEVTDILLDVDSRCVDELPITGVLAGVDGPVSVDDLIADLHEAIARNGLQDFLKKIAAARSEAALVSLLTKRSAGKPRPRSKLSDVFERVSCPTIGLGYMAGHRQQWINTGLSLGEVVYSISLAPGESRNIAKVNWYRRQSIARSEQTRIDESLTARFVQNRALEEITSAVAREQQAGGSSTEAGTTSTAVSMVGALAIGAGVGATIGTVIAPGPGTIVGAAVGAGISGVVAGGIVASGANTLGQIEADSSGDRSIVAQSQQRIQLSTSQAASAARSVWSTIVVEDTQAEGVEASTSNITNYNHMHALNLQYYEVLQRYLVRIELDRVQPFMILPYTVLDFSGFRYIRDYWDVVRNHIDDEDLRAQGDSYFATEAVPSKPDLWPVPEISARPNGTVRDLKVRLLYQSAHAVKFGLFADDMDGVAIEGVEAHPPTVGSGRTVRIFSFDLLKAANELRFTLSMDRAKSDDFTVHLSIVEADVRGEGQRHKVRDKSLGSIAIRKTEKVRDYTIEWNMPDVSPVSGGKHALEKAKRAKVIAHNEAAQSAYDALVGDLSRFEQRLQRLVLRRRHYFTRVILSAIEPEELMNLVGAVIIRPQAAAHSASPGPGLPLKAIADIQPVGFTAGGIILKMKRLDAAAAAAVLARNGLTGPVPPAINRLTRFAADVIDDFEARQQDAPIVSSDTVHVPTGGLFAEAVLGRSNSAEYLDPERFFNWVDSQIPNAAPNIADVGLESRFQTTALNVTNPTGNLTIQSPVGLPDATGMQNVLSAIQNGSMFRDMSKAEQLAAIVGKLADLSASMGEAASKMTGEAAAATAKAAADLASGALSAAQSATAKGAELAMADKLDREEAKAEEKTAAAAAQPPVPAVPGQAPNPIPPAPVVPPKKPTRKSRVAAKQAGIEAPRAGATVTDSTFTFLFDLAAGTSISEAFSLIVRKDGLIIDGKTAVAREELAVELSFRSGVAQVGIQQLDTTSPIIMSLEGTINSRLANVFTSVSKAYLVPPSLNNYIFNITEETEVIEVVAKSEVEAKAALSGKIDIAGSLGVEDPAAEPPAGGAAAPRPAPAKKPRLKRLPKLPMAVIAMIIDRIASEFDADASAALAANAGASGSASVTVQHVFRFHVPTGKLTMTFDKDNSI